MSQVTRVMVPFAIAAAALLVATAESAAQSQDKPKPPTASQRTPDMSAFLCKDITRLSGEDRSIAIGVLHGYFLGKKGATGYDSSALGKASDDFMEYCLDNPGAKALETFAKFAK